MNILKRLSEIVALAGPHEIIALTLFLATVAIWAVTLEALYR